VRCSHVQRPTPETDAAGEENGGGGGGEGGHTHGGLVHVLCRDLCEVCVVVSKVVTALLQQETCRLL